MNKYKRFFIYALIVVGVVVTPVSMPNEKIKKINISSNIVNVTLIKPPTKKKKKKVIKKSKPKPKPKPKKKPKPKPKPKVIPKPVVKKIEPIVEKEPEIEEVVEEKPELKTQDDLEQKRELALAKQAEKTYYDTIYEVISDNKRYPKRARRYKKEGSVKVSFRVLEDGTITNLKLIKLSKHKSLNKAVRKLFDKLRSFPPPPSNLSFPLELSITINYKLRR